jgi:hypothetical protein
MREQVDVADKEHEKTREDPGLLDPRSSVHTAMFTISPGDEPALEEHGAGGTAKSVGDVCSRIALPKKRLISPRLKLFSAWLSKCG